MSILSRLKRAAVALLTPDDDVRERVDLMKAIIQMEHHCTALITRLEHAAAAAHDDWQEAVARIEVLEQDLLHAQQDAARHEAMREDGILIGKALASTEQGAREDDAATTKALEAAEQTEQAMDEIGTIVGLNGIFDTADIVTTVRELVAQLEQDRTQAQAQAAYIEAQRAQIAELRARLEPR